MSFLQELISYRVRKLADLLGKSATMRYRRQLGVSLLEWRALALIGEFSPLSLNELAEHAALDKSQASRVISSLVRRRLVRRGRNDRDGRGVQLALSAGGSRVCRRLLQEASGRNDQLLKCLSSFEFETLDLVLKKLTREGKRLHEVELGLSQTGGRSRKAKPR